MLQRETGWREKYCRDIQSGGGLVHRDRLERGVLRGGMYLREDCYRKITKGMREEFLKQRDRLEGGVLQRRTDWREEG